MRTRSQLAVATLDASRAVLLGNLQPLTLEEALDTAGGYRSVLGILKHVASWTHVYHAYAFESNPRHLDRLEWPRGMRDTIERSQAYLDDVILWLNNGIALWMESIGASPEEALDEARPCHWGGELPLFDIVLMVATHWAYHAGEINEILSIRRGEAWEYTEEVEENHLSTVGHRTRPNWMSDEQARAWEAHLARRDDELRHHGRD